MSFNRSPKRYRGTDGVMRTLTETAVHMGITTDELRLKWYGAKMPNHIRNDSKYWHHVKRRQFTEGR